MPKMKLFIEKNAPWNQLNNLENIKLIELNKKFNFLKNGINVLDLGSCPGGWCQVVKKKIIKRK